MNNAKGTIIGIVGGLIGFGLGMIFTKKKYAKIAKDEIEEIREYYKNKDLKKKEKADEILEEIKEEASNAVRCAQNIILNNSYIEKGDKTVDPDEMENPIEEISPDDYGFMDGYGSETWYYYESNDIIADSDNNIMDSPEMYLGDTIMKKMSESDYCDSLYIRNHKNRTDYEILKSLRDWNDIAGFDSIRIG